MGDDSKTCDAVGEAFKKALNAHGHAFQYTVLGRCHQLNKTGLSPWRFEVPEFPVELHEIRVHIDFIVRHEGRLIVAECKRANPATANWCFAKAPYVRRNRNVVPGIFEYLWIEPTTGRLFARAVSTIPRDLFHVAAEVRTGNKGDEGGKGRGVIDEALTQVCRGLNGLIDLMSTNPQLLRGTTVAVLVPVIFTTAQLYASNVDLDAADIDSGTLASANVVKVPWLWYQHNLTSALRHSIPRDVKAEQLDSLGALLEFEHARSIAIVSASGIPSFLAELLETLDTLEPLRS